MKNNKIIQWIIEKKDYLLILFCIAISIPIILPFVHSGYFPTHDGEWAVVRLADMFRTLRDFQIPARYSGNLNFGYGYPLFNFNYPFPYYFSVLFHFINLSFVDSIKLTFALSVPISAIGMYLLSKKLWSSSLGALASAILYVYLPYRIVDLYVRGSIGECIAFAIVPFLYFSILKVVDGKNSNVWIILTSILYAVLLTSHNIMAVFFSIILGVLVIFLAFQNKKRILPLTLAIIMGILLSAFFTFPALFEKHNVLLSIIPIANRSIYFVQPDQLLLSPWGYGAPADVKDPFTYQLGLGQIASFLLIIVYIVVEAIKNKGKKIDFRTKFAATLVLITLLLGLLLFSWSNVVWENTPLLSDINYPWILIGVIGFLISLITGFAFSHKVTSAIIILFALAAIYFVLPNAHPQEFTDRGDNLYITNNATTTSSNEVMPVWVKQIPTERFTEEVRVVKGAGSVTDISSNSKTVSFTFNSQTPAVVEVARIYYPGWRATSNGIDKAIYYDNARGLINIKLNSGRQDVKIKFGETPFRLFSDLISVAALCGLVVIFFKHKDGEIANK